MRDVQPIIEEIHRLAAERRARLAADADEVSAPPPVAYVDLRTPITIRDGHPLRWLLALADRVRARVLEAVLIRQSEFNRQTSSAFTFLATRLEQIDRERRQLNEFCESLVSRVESAVARTLEVESRLLRIQPTAPLERLAGDLYRDPLFARVQAALRGDEQTIRERQRAYLDVFAGTEGTILDLGCGRGEFLGLLGDAQRSARGVDLSSDNVRQCREKGFDVVEGDALEYLTSLDNGSLGGIFSAQVIEHLSPEYLLALVRACFVKLRPGAPIALETINADSLAVMPTFYADLSHSRLIPPATATLLLEACGFQGVGIRYTSAFPPAERLAPSADDTPLAKRFDEAVAKLNQTVWGAREYAVIATR